MARTLLQRSGQSVEYDHVSDQTSAAQKLAAFLHHEISLAQLVDWAEAVLLDGEFAEGEAESLRFVISRLGVADVRAFDCENLLDKLGYRARVEIIA